MTRTALVIAGLAILVGAAITAGVALIDTHGRDTPTASREPSDERAPEAENHNAGDLPAVEHAARRFLAGYLPLIYGKPNASTDQLQSASPRLVAAVEAEGGHVTPAQSERTPKLQRVAVIKHGAINALATAQIKDSPSPAYPLVFHLHKTTEGWVVTRIGGP